MRTLFMLATTLLLSACGLEGATTAATVGKLQADQAKQAQQTLDNSKAEIDAALKQSEDRLKRADSAN